MSEIRNELSCLKDRPELLFAMLYGSAAEEGDFRDLDIGLFVDRASVPASMDLDYAFMLADELGKVVPHPVDVRVINDAPLPFRYNVSRGIALAVNDMARFRNLIVHLYWKEDNSRVFQIIRDDLEDLDAFRQQVGSWLDI